MDSFIREFYRCVSFKTLKRKKDDRFAQQAQNGTSKNELQMNKGSKK